MAVDWTDPCARATALRDAYYRVVSGEREIEIVTRTADAEERVRFSSVDLQALKAEWQAAEEECQRSNGVTPTPRRSAIRLGGVGRRGPFGVC
jgi:hypothetical protein